uniref:Uncharacterized protein n=1 Tax=Cacopsylla melanoneura TaxID=428564 RepID=A0A8D8YHZ1_9HEMI
MNFISNQDISHGDGDKGLSYKIIKFDKNDKDSINSFLQNNNIEIISQSQLNAANNNVNPSQIGPNDVLLSNFQNKEILLSSLNVNKGNADIATSESNGPLNTKENEIPKDILPTPLGPVESNEDQYKTVILSNNKEQPEAGSHAIFYNPNNIVGSSGKEGEIFDSKPSETLKDIPTIKENADNVTSSENKTADVQFFSVPLVAAFTLEQNSFGIPQKVTPLNYLENGEVISEERVKGIEGTIILNKQQQKVAEKANNTKEVEELKAKQVYLEREKIYVDEKLREFRQNENKEKLIHQQSIGLQTANLEQYLQKFNREPKYNNDFSSLQFGNTNLELKKQQLQEQFAREAELERYKKLEYEKIQELNRLEKLKQFEKNLQQFEQRELGNIQPKPTIQSQEFRPSFPLVNLENLPPVDFQKSLNVQYSQFPVQSNFATIQPSIQPNQPTFAPSQSNQPTFTPVQQTQPIFSTNNPTFAPQASFQPQPSFQSNNYQSNFISNAPRAQPNFNQAPPQQSGFVPSQNIAKQPPQFNPNPFQQIPRQNFQPNFQPNNNNFIPLPQQQQYPQQNFQQGRSFPVDSFRPSQFQNNFQSFQNNFQPLQSQFNQPFVQQPFLSNNRIVRKEPFQSVGNFGFNNKDTFQSVSSFGVNNFLPQSTKSNTFKRNIIPPSRVLEPPFV